MGEKENRVILKDGAWLIADSHYARYNTLLYDFLSSVAPQNLPPQLILMGDIFDLLFGYAQNSIQPNRKMVDLLKQIARECEVIYLEGNHDFGLKPIFAELVKVVPRSAQPLVCEAGEVRVALHHGDTLQGLGYELYTAVIRNRFVDRALNMLDTFTGGSVIDWLESYNRKKRPCYEIEDFEERMRSRLDILMNRYSFDYWIEGHFHQDIGFEHRGVSYFNLPALSCAKRYIVIRSADGFIGLEERSVT